MKKTLFFTLLLSVATNSVYGSGLDSFQAQEEPESSLKTVSVDEMPNNADIGQTSAPHHPILDVGQLSLGGRLSVIKNGLTNSSDEESVGLLNSGIASGLNIACMLQITKWTPVEKPLSRERLMGFWKEQLAKNGLTEPQMQQLLSQLLTNDEKEALVSEMFNSRALLAASIGSFIFRHLSSESDKFLFMKTLMDSVRSGHLTYSDTVPFLFDLSYNQLISLIKWWYESYGQTDEFGDDVIGIFSVMMANRFVYNTAQSDGFYKPNAIGNALYRIETSLMQGSTLSSSVQRARKHIDDARPSGSPEH